MLLIREVLWRASFHILFSAFPRLTFIVFCSCICILYEAAYRWYWSENQSLMKSFHQLFSAFPDFHSSLETIMTSSLSFTVSTAASLSKQYMIYANNFWRKKCWTMHQVPKWNKSFDTNLCNKYIISISLSFLICFCICKYMYLNEWNNCCLNLCISLSLVICIPGSTLYLWKKRSTNR